MHIWIHKEGRFEVTMQVSRRGKREIKQAFPKIFSREIIAFLTQFSDNFSMTGARRFGKNDRAEIHNL